MGSALDLIKPAPVVRLAHPDQDRLSSNSSCKRCRRLVGAEGLEPPQLSSLEPKSSASTSSATPADSITSGRDAASGGLITWAHRSAAKKWPFQSLPGSTCGNWTYPAENGPHLTWLIELSGWTDAS